MVKVLQVSLLVYISNENTIVQLLPTAHYQPSALYICFSRQLKEKKNEWV